MKARLITPFGSFADRYYAIAILYGNHEIKLKCPTHYYPSAPEDEGTDRQEGLNETARKFFQELVDKINSEACPHHWNNGGECAP